MDVDVDVHDSHKPCADGEVSAVTQFLSAQTRTTHEVHLLLQTQLRMARLMALQGRIPKLTMVHINIVVWQRDGVWDVLADTVCHERTPDNEVLLQVPCDGFQGMEHILQHYGCFPRRA